MKDIRRDDTGSEAGTTALHRPSGASPLHKIVLHLAWAAGLLLLGGDIAAGQGVCDRTPQVRDALVRATGIATCEEVTTAHFAQVANLNLQRTQIGTLQADDFRGLSSLRRLDLSRNFLTTVPAGIFNGLSKLRSLSLSNNRLTAIPEGVFSDLSSLRWMDLSWNSLTILPEGGFKGLHNLSFLFLPNNSLTILPKGIFNGLTNLSQLTLNDNSLTTLSTGVFSEQSNLYELALSDNALTTLPAGVFNGLTGLRSLNLANNSLTALPEGVFSDVGTLASLYLSRNSLTTLPEGIFRGLRDLENLELSSNSLTTLPSGLFNGLNNLVWLWLDNNSLTSMHEGIFKGLTRLFELRLNGNSLTTLPAVIFSDLSRMNRLELQDNSLLILPQEIFSRLSSLDSLHLSKYSLATLPMGAFSELDTLRSLTLSGNSLTSLPAGVFNELSNLFELTFSNNSLTSLTVGIFNGLSNLVRLDLSGNSLTTLPTRAFGGLASLVSLDLSDNSLTSLPEGTFSGLSSLGYLGLSSNSLTTLPTRAFGGLASLVSLDLSDNSLTTLPEGVFTEMSSLESLILSGNSLTTLPQRIFNGLSSLSSLKLDSNSLATLPEGIFRGLRAMSLLWLQENKLQHLPARLFSGLDRLFILKLRHNHLRELPKGIFDDVLDTLGFWWGVFEDAIPGELSLDTDLKAALAFHPTEQRASGGAIVRARVTLSRSLPVAVRVPFSVGGTATVDDYNDLTPLPSEGLLFLAGETSKEITFALAESANNQGKTVVLTLANLLNVGLRISNGTGPDAPSLSAYSFLKSAEEGSSHTVTIVSGGSVPDDPTPHPERDIFVPVILSSAGLSNSFFTSELTLTNRSSEPAVLNYTYTAHLGEGSGTATDTLPPGGQRIETNAIDYLKRLGIPIPDSGKRIGTLRVQEASGSSEVGVMVRTTTAVTDGRAGLAYPGIPGDEGYLKAVYLCGLRQNQQDRSNVAFQNMGASQEGAITVRTTVFSGDAAVSSPRVLHDVTLRPGEFHQYTEVLKVLGSTANGYVKVERVEGTAPFYAYGVINDQANSDGSFVFPVGESSLAEAVGQTLPVVVERAPFASELTVTNFSDKEKTVTFRLVSSAIETNDHTATFPLQLKAGEQHIIPNVIDRARHLTSGLDLPGGLAGPLFAEVENGDISGIVIGARTGSPGSVGRYGVFYNAVPFGQSFTTVAWVDALQQNQENRSNLALVNTGEIDDSPSQFNLEIYNGGTGLLVNTATGFRVAARHWRQIDGILAKYGMGTRQGYVRIEKISGNNPFLAYGVINDGGVRLQRSDDGAYLPARE